MGHGIGVPVSASTVTDNLLLAHTLCSSKGNYDLMWVMIFSQ